MSTCGIDRSLRLKEQSCCVFFFQAEDGIRDLTVTGVQTCALPISEKPTVATTTTRVGARGGNRAPRRPREREEGPAARAPSPRSRSYPTPSASACSHRDWWNPDRPAHRKEGTPASTRKPAGASKACPLP